MVQASGREAWPAVSSSCATGCSGRWATSCMQLRRMRAPAAAPAAWLSSQQFPAACSQRWRRDAVLGHQAGFQRIAQLAVHQLALQVGDTGWSRAHSLMPEISKMSREAMISRVSLASRITASACGLARRRGQRPGAGTTRSRSATAATARDRLTLTNHPITGPMFSGPQQQPFVCTTNQGAVGRQPLVDSATAPGYKVTDSLGQPHRLQPRLLDRHLRHLPLPQHRRQPGWRCRPTAAARPT
jgi:hypothetical protein